LSQQGRSVRRDSPVPDSRPTRDTVMGGRRRRPGQLHPQAAGRGPRAASLAVSPNP